MEKKEKTTEQANNLSVAYKTTADVVLARVDEMKEEGVLKLPANYAVGNALKSAWLLLQETKDKDGKPVLEVCSKETIANALLDMVIQGLSVSKKQGYFIGYGTQLQFQRSYFGTLALAKRCGAVTEEPVANVIYKGDNFVYEINPQTGRMHVVKHEQDFQNIIPQNIVGAYAIAQLPNGDTQTTIMSIDQIKKSWAQGKGGGNTKAHQNFPDEMCKKTVIGRACKTAINSSDDAWILDGRTDDEDVDTHVEQRDAEVKQGNAVIDLQEGVDVQEVASTPEPKAPANKDNEKDPY